MAERIVWTVVREGKQWIVRREGRHRAMGVFDTRDGAMARATAAARRRCPSRVVECSDAGWVLDSVDFERSSSDDDG